MAEISGGSGSQSLKPFQFIEGRPTSAWFTQASNQADDNGTEEPDRENRVPAQMQQSQAKSPQMQKKPPPSTPATRLPLADLIGNAEDATGSAANERVSPEEHIQWHTSRSPRSSQSKTTPLTKNKKRPRSSSPPSSSNKKAAHALGSETGALDLETLKNTLKTPRADPVADLWNRYAGNTGRDGAADGKPPLYNQLLGMSSPQAGEDQASNVGGFRRWTSCGMGWPSSKSKRRKMRHTNTAEDIDTSGAFEQPNFDERIQHTKKSRIGSLIEQMEESITRAREPVEPKGPSSSSPLPDRVERFDRKSISPTRQLTTGVILKNNAIPSQETIGAKTVSAGDNLARDAAKSSSFGSDDIDIVALAEPFVTNDAGLNLNEISNSLPGNVVNEEDLQLDDIVDEFDDDDEFTMEDFDAAASFVGPATAVAVGVNADRSMSQVPKTQTPGAGGNLEDFSDDDVDEELFAAAEFAATQSIRTSTISKSSRDQSKKRQAIQRYLIKNVAEGHYKMNSGENLPEKVLLVEDENSKLSKAITLRQSWFDTRCTKGSYVHVIGDFDQGGQCLINDTQNMLILHPDHLVSALVVADSFSCLRRAVLQDRVKATSDASPWTLYGTMLHEIFQEALAANRWDNEWLRGTIEGVIARHIEDIYDVKLDVPQAIEHLRSKTPELQAWAEIFVKASPSSNGVVKDRNGAQISLCVNKLVDVEEHIWSPKYGLKGNIDATVQINMVDVDGQRNLIAPLELKTGKNTTNTSHRAQTALYTLLLSDRYDVAVAYGLLYYLETSEVSRIPAIRHELRHMIMQRNELACYIRERLSLPPMLKNAHACNRCYAKVTCFTYHKLVEDGNGESSGLRDKFDEVVRHLKPSDQRFFTKWDELLTEEESEMMKFRRELWTMESKEREKLGRCFANVVLDTTEACEEIGTSKINRYRYTFRKFNKASDFSFNESQIAPGEPIVISDEKGHFAFAKGYVTSIRKRHVTVAVDRKLQNVRRRQRGFHANTNQTFVGIMDVESSPAQKESSAPESDRILYRMDKDEFSNGMATVRNNLVELMNDNTFRSRELRGLIVDGVPPRFKQQSSAYALSGPASQMNMNEDQRKAIEHILAAEDYALVLGMPGTGKTTTIAHIIRALVAKGKSVLLTSYTHTAVDNILLKIRQDKIGILRLGATAKIHPEVREFAYLAAAPKTSIEEVEKMYQSPQVVATTCLGINHSVFKERVFDYCIVDEASQLTLPVCLGPIRMAKAFVLVGDHYQLPPLVQNRRAQEGGLDVSLFKVLSERQPSAVSTLRYQYRMNEEIMSLSNELIYNGQLVCGSEAVAKRVMEIQKPDFLSTLHATLAPSQQQPTYCTSAASPECWLNATLAPGSNPVVFLNTDSLCAQASEILSGNRITNPLEARITMQLLHALILAGVPPTAVGVITLYRSQLALIKSYMQPQSSNASSNVIPNSVTAAAEQIEAHTADRFQGRDKEITILSCVRSNEVSNVGDLLRDWRRVNVALTRARSKLIIIGSKSTLAKGDEILGKLVERCEKMNWILDLPSMAAEEGGGHLWDRTPNALPSSISNEVSPQKVAPSQRDKLQQRDERPAGKARQPLLATSVNKAFKLPAKVGKVGENAILGGLKARARRPVLADIINDVVGEDF